MSSFRGATVEDLQLSPALVLATDISISTALRLAFERDFSILPLSNPATRRLEGWIDIGALRTQLENGSVREEMELGALKTEALKRFPKADAYQVLTPDTPLEELEQFFVEGKARNVSFALVTDADRKFVLGVVTADDLEKFSSRRNPSKSS